MDNNLLITIANELDQKGKHELADAVDNVIKSAAGRPKAPLKALDEDVKKDLMKFLATVKKNMEDSMEALEELFRRLRYFDIADVVKDLGLDKVLKDMEKTNDCMDNATKSMYSLVHGKKPSKSDMEQMAEDFELESDPRESPLDFFERRAPTQSISFDEREVDIAEEERDDFQKSDLGLKHEMKYNLQPMPIEQERELESPAGYHDYEEEEPVDEEELHSFWSGDEDDEE